MSERGVMLRLKAGLKTRTTSEQQYRSEDPHYTRNSNAGLQTRTTREQQGRI
jgi:hypothetical protein